MAELSADPVRRVLERPLAPYYLLAASSGALVLLGLVMVFSASSVRSYATGSSATVAQNQAVYVVLGLLLAVLASRMPVRVWRALASPALLGWRCWCWCWCRGWAARSTAPRAGSPCREGCRCSRARWPSSRW